MNASLYLVASILNVATPDSNTYNFFPVASGSVRFQVRAPHNAHISLTTGPQDTDPILEIFIGGWENSKSAIRKNKVATNVAEAETPDILSNDEFRGFWIQWDGGRISVGREGQLNAFLTWTDPSPFYITNFGICTKWGSTGTWTIEGGSQVNTPDSSQYIYNPVMSGYLELEFRGPHNAHLCLTTTAETVDPMYEFILGGWENQESVIRYNRQTPDKVIASTPNLWSADEFRKIRIEWRNGRLSVIHAQTGLTIMFWEDPNPFHIKNFGVRTTWGATGNWRISNFYNSGSLSQTYLTTPPINQYQVFPITSGSVQFKVKLPHDAHVLLASTDQVSDPMIEILIGGWYNTMSVIRRNRSSDPNELEVETIDFMHEDEFRGFWIRWDRTVISVGKEGEAFPFMSWINDDPFVMNVIGFRSNWSNATGVWLIDGVGWS